MEDYDVFNEMNDIKTIIMGIDENNPNFWQKHLLDNELFEFMPIRFDYCLDKYNLDYIEHTKSLFTYYFNNKNTYNNELLKLKKHFIHFQRFPQIVFIPNDIKYINLKNMIKDIGIKVVSTEEEVVNFIESNIN